MTLALKATKKTELQIMGEVIAGLTRTSFATLKKVDQGGALQARRLSTGAVQFYWRYTHEGKTDRVAIGVHDPTAPPKQLTPTAKGYGIAAAIEACREKAKLHNEKLGQGGYREHLAAEVLAFKARRIKRVADQQHTLEMLMTTYSDYLESKGRRSHSDARSIFKLHVTDAWPALAKKPASSIQTGEVTDMMRKLAESGKGRTANKLRAYLRAAYQCALDVETLASIPVAFKAFAITSNPAGLTKRDASQDRSDKNPLSADQMRAYWRAIKDMPGVRGASLRIHLLTGGQRIEQLCRLKVADVGNTSFSIFDGKGRPGQGARKHVLPITPQVREALSQLPKAGDQVRVPSGGSAAAEFVLSTDGGKTHVSAATLSQWACEAAAAIPAFQLKRVRSGVETMLASAGVSRDIRGHLQSHGLTGIQARHYDGHDYLPEKLAALETLFAMLNVDPVTQLVEADATQETAIKSTRKRVR
jgi:integrase